MEEYIYDKIEEYTEMIKHNPPKSEYYYERGKLKKWLGNHKGAIRDFNKAKTLKKIIQNK